MNESMRRVCSIACLTQLLLLTACGQTGQLLLPGSQPAGEAASAAEDEEEDETEQ